ncbi:MAG: hypothetical protein AAGB12_12825 [Pseudomonadota bacterium]
MPTQSFKTTHHEKDHKPQQAAIKTLRDWAEHPYLIVSFTTHPQQPDTFLEIAFLDSLGNAYQSFIKPRVLQPIADAGLQPQGLSRQDFRLALHWDFFQEAFLQVLNKRVYRHHLTNNANLFNQLLAHHYQAYTTVTLPRFSDVLEIFCPLSAAISGAEKSLRRRPDGLNQLLASRGLVAATSNRPVYRPLEGCQIIEKLLKQYYQSLQSPKVRQ